MLVWERLGYGSFSATSSVMGLVAMKIRDVLAEVLGYEPARVEMLRDSGALGT